MAQYPSSVVSLVDPQPTDRLNSPSHSALHQSENAEIEAIETFVGTTSTSVVGTIIYDVRSPLSNGGGHIQTANKGGTGQITYNKGDTLVGQSSSVLTKLAVGTNDQVIVADSAAAIGLRWGNVPGTNIQSFLGTGTWNKPSNLGVSGQVFVQLWGGGASGAVSSILNAAHAGGGGGGSYAWGYFKASVLGASELVVVGGGGASVVGTVSNGLQGDITVFGTTASLLTAWGGGAGSIGAGNGSGGAGGGVFGTGSAGVNGTTGGNGGIQPGGTVASIFGGGGGASLQPGASGLYAGGGGGGRNNGGSAMYGGGGGGGSINSVAGAGIGGVSNLGGNGGAGGSLSNGTAGSQPGGGGGGGQAASTTVRSGKGGDGMAVIISFAP